MTAPVNPLVAPVPESAPAPWAGIWIAEDIEMIAAGVRAGSWVESTLGVAGGGLDALALAVDPVGALLQYGIAWLIEHVEPLAETLDWLAGDPAQIAAHAQTWRNVAASLAQDAEALGRAVRWDTTEWIGAAGDAYRAWAAGRAQTLAALGQAADAMAAMTEGAGILIGTVRLMVRDAVAVVVSRLVVYAGELLITGGLAAPVVVGQVGALCASWGARIAGWLRDLIASLRRLLGEGDRLSRLVEKLKSVHSEGRSSGADGAGGGARDSGGGTPQRLPGFDPSSQHGPLGADFRAGVVDPADTFAAKETSIAQRLADEGAMVHARRVEQVENWSNPDAMVRLGPDDPGTVTEFKTLQSSSSSSFKKNMLDAAAQLAQHGGGTVVIDGRAAGITVDEAQRGYARAVGQARAHGSPLPDRVRLILSDGSIIEIP